ncbi:MAG TPA: DUF1761 domain-containing protein [Candidatus Saccharimonadales bacterium]|nr:DUF1761 domain-containing protein [Candidatus Saccharimonadales bacterium]
MISILASTGLILMDQYGNPAVSINWLGALLALIAAMVIGSLWYGPLFGKRWMKIVGHKRGESSPLVPMLIMLVLAAVQVVVIAHFIAYTGYFYPDYSGVTTGLLTGLWAFVGFIIPLLVSNTVFSKGSTELLKIHLGNQLVTLLAIGAILGAVN